MKTITLLLLAVIPLFVSAQQQNFHFRSKEERKYDLMYRSLFLSDNHHYHFSKEKEQKAEELKSFKAEIFYEKRNGKIKPWMQGNFSYKLDQQTILSDIQITDKKRNRTIYLSSKFKKGDPSYRTFYSNGQSVKLRDPRTKLCMMNGKTIYEGAYEHTSQNNM